MGCPMNLGIHMKSNNKIFSLMLSALLFSVTAFATAAAENIELKPGHPEQYTVKKGDTLWDISGKFLSKPWLWPEIWKINTQIENPHLIYPGDVLNLVYIDGKPYITRGRHGKRTVRLSPETRIENLDRAIPTIPLDIIDPYLTKNRILNAGEYAASGYIVGIKDDHMSAGAGDSIYVRALDKNDPEQIYGIYRRGNAYKNPHKRHEVLGYEAFYLGEGTVAREGNPATIYVEKSKAEILKGHHVIAITKSKIVDANFLPKSSSVTRAATIIGVLTNGMMDGVDIVGALDVVILDIGLEDGVEKGDVLNIYKRGSTVKDPYRNNTLVKLPNEIAGNLMIFRTFKRLSYALVMDAQTTLRVGDLAKSPFMDD